MTTIRIPALAADGLGDITGLATTVLVRLVDGQGRPVIGLRTSDGVPVTTDAVETMAADGTPWEVDLTPQSAIATVDGEPTWYAIEIIARTSKARWLVQVPDSGETLDLATLIAGAAVAPADILAGRLLSLDERAALDAAAAPSGLNPFATIADLPT